MSRLIRSVILIAALVTLVAVSVPPSAPAQDKLKEKEKDAKDAKDAKGGAVEVFKDKAGEYRWHVTDADGKVIAMTPKGYDSKADCLKALEAVKATLGKVKVTEVHRDPPAKKDK